MKTLEGGRISIGALSLGIAQGALDQALRYASEREQFGKPLLKNTEFPNVLSLLGKVIIEPKVKIVISTCTLNH